MNGASHFSIALWEAFFGFIMICGQACYKSKYLVHEYVNKGTLMIKHTYLIPGEDLVISTTLAALESHMLHLFGDVSGLCNPILLWSLDDELGGIQKGCSSIQYMQLASALLEGFVGQVCYVFGVSATGLIQYGHASGFTTIFSWVDL